MTVFNQQGRQIATVASGIKPAGRHEAVWKTKQVPAGVYIARLVLDNCAGWAGKIIVGK